MRIRPGAGNVIRAGILAAVLMTATGPALAGPDSNQSEAIASTPPTVTPAEIQFTRDTLRPGEPEEVGLLPEYIRRLRTDAEAYLSPTPDHPGFPTYAGAVVLAAKDGVVVGHAAVGMAVRYAAAGPPPGRIGVELPAAAQLPMRPDTIFDLASVSKLFTTVVVLQQVEQGRVALDSPVADYLPEFATGGKSTVTVRMLLTHTSGLPAWAPLWSRYPTPEERLAAALATPLAAGASPGNQYVYSDLGLIALGALLERVTGKPLDVLVRDGVTGPLGMTDTGYNPGVDSRARIAATEYQPYAGRGLVWGEVHDENAWSLGGVAGHAGLFSTAGDLAVFCQMLLNGGQYRGVRVLRESTVRDMLVNYNAHLESRYPDSDRGLGFELNKPSYMGPLASPVTFGHTGFTGTSLVIDPLSHSFLILLSNRVHPDRGWGTNTVARRALAQDLAYAMPVRPLGGDTAWRADNVDRAAGTLVAPLRRPAVGAAVASFNLWYDTEPRYDTVRLEVSADGGLTWQPLAFTLHAADHRWTAPEGAVTGYGGRQWWQVRAELPAGATALRWSYRTDGSVRGRGAHVDSVRVTDDEGLLFHDRTADEQRYVATGWHRCDPC